MEDLKQYENNPMILGQIKRAGSVEAWKESLAVRGSVGGKKSTYKRTAEQRKAASERTKAIWAARRGEDT